MRVTESQRAAWCRAYAVDCAESLARQYHAECERSGIRFKNNDGSIEPSSLGLWRKVFRHAAEAFL